MPLETGNTVADLNELWPLGSDPKSQGDDHLRLIKDVLKWTFDSLDDQQLQEILSDYVAKAGDTMTGALNVVHSNSENIVLLPDPDGNDTMVIRFMYQDGVTQAAAVYYSSSTQQLRIANYEPDGSSGSGIYGFDNDFTGDLSRTSSVVNRRTGDARYAQTLAVKALAELFVNKGLLTRQEIDASLSVAVADPPEPVDPAR